MTSWIADLEADGFVEEATTVWCGVFKTVDGSQTVRFSPLDGDGYVERMLKWMDEQECLIFHYGYGYDFPLLKKLYNYEYKGLKLDTVVMSRLQSPKRFVPPHCPVKDKPHSVETWGYRVGRGKPEHNDWSQFSPEMLHRCEEDVEIQRLTYHYLIKEQGQHNWQPALKLTHRLFEILQKQEEYGWLVDQEWMRKSVHMLDHWMQRIDSVLNDRLPMVLEVDEDKVKGEYRHVREPFKINGQYNANITKWMLEQGFDPASRPIGGPFTRINFRRMSLNKPDEVKAFLLDSGWEPLEWNTNDAGERTSPKLNKDDPFEGVEGGVGRLLAKYVQCKSRKAIIEGWFNLIRADGRIASRVTNLAETGRATHGGIVNIPNAEAFFGKWMRKAFIAKEGWVLVGTDSAGCQIRMLAARMKDKSYTDTVLNGDKDKGTDIHSVNMRAAGLDSRGKAKTFFYGFLFGAGDAKTGRIVKGTSADGKRLKAQFLEGLPALAALLDELIAEWRSNAKKRPNKWGRGVEYYDGRVKGLDGRPIFCKSEHALLCYVLQSDEAILMATAYCWAYKDLCSKFKYGVDFGFVNWMHDELNVECKPEIAKEVGEVVASCITKAGAYLKIACKHEGEAAIGYNWYTIH